MSITQSQKFCQHIDFDPSIQKTPKVQLATALICPILKLPEVAEECSSENNMDPLRTV